MDENSSPTITAYDIGGQGCGIREASSRRPWMDATHDRFAYRCLPMTIANACGWELLCPTGFTATWNGGKHNKADISIQFDEACHPFTQSHFMHGILTFHTGYLFRTPRDANLWVRGPVNSPKHGIQPLEGIVETDWTPATFTMNWIFTEPGEIRFEKGEPFCAILPYPRLYIEQFEGQFASLADHPDLQARFETWQRGRGEFLQNLPNPDHPANKQRWQKDYMLGKVDAGAAFEPHQTKLTLKPFSGERPAASRAAPIPSATPAPQPLPYQRKKKTKLPLYTSIVVSPAIPTGQAPQPIKPKPPVAGKQAPPAASEKTDVLVQERFLSAEDCQELIAAFERCQPLLFRSPDKNDRFFDNRFLWINSLPTETERTAKRIMQAARYRLIEAIRQFYGERDPIYSDTIQLVRWSEGMSMPPHADNAHPDGSPHELVHRKYASVVYLNEDYEGGELYLPRVGIEVKPKQGLLVGFRGDFTHEHGVKLITRGIRYTMPGWYSEDIRHQDPYARDVY